MRLYIPLLLLTSLLNISVISAAVIPYYSTHSPGVNTPRHLVGITTVCRNIDDTDNHFCIISATPAYTRTFRNNHITECLFGHNQSCNTPTIKISGSTVAHRGSQDWLADYFYLPTDFESTLTFSPRIDNFIVDLSAYFNFDWFQHHLYAVFYAPFVHTRWHLHMKEQIINKGVNTHQAGYFTPAPLERKHLLQDFTHYAQGATIDPLVQSFNNSSFTIATQRLLNAKISPTRKKKSRMADLRAQCGWHVIDDEDKQLNIYVEVTAPLGNKPRGLFLFEPIAGNGHHWELGAGFNAAYSIWYNTDASKIMTIQLYATVTHLLDTRQYRTFDLKDKPFSRYMLAEKLGTMRRDPSLSGTSNAGVEFQREFAPVANLTRFNVDVSVAAQAEIGIIGTFNCKNISCDIGYNVWTRSKEHIQPRGFNMLQNNETWALKGDAFIYGFQQNDNVAVHLAPTQDEATIQTGTNSTRAVTTNPTQAANTNVGVDNPVIATTVNGAVVNANGQPMRTSNPVIFIKESDVAIEESETKGLSSTLFTHFNYTWSDHDDWVPFLGFGGEIAFDHAHHSSNNKSQTLRCSPSYWGFWIKGGIAFK